MDVDMFSRHSENGSDGFITMESFVDLCKALFLPGDLLKQELTETVFKQYNTKQDGRMTEDEFKSCWKTWIYPVLHPKTALLVVDVQNDFISGTLALKNTPSGQDGAEVVPVINKILDDWKFDLVAYSQDWHPYDHISFIDNVMLRKTHPSSKIAAQEAAVYDEIVFATEPPTVQTLWPAHCLQNSEGAKIHPNLKIFPGHILTRKGTHPEYDSYSSFFNNLGTMHTELNAILRQHHITDVFICGLAFDYCVKYTALDARKLGFGTIVIEDACRSISDEGYRTTREELHQQECLITSSEQLNLYLDRDVRHPDLAFRDISSSF
ncbi:nicotinamidase-like isoform X2 [Apostichopus japonicus]